MLRGIGYVVARRDCDDPEEPRDLARFIEALFRGLMGRFGSEPRHGWESASARRPR